MDAATLAVVRASRPTLRSAHDKLAFAVHALLLAEGFKLVATGGEAEDESRDFSASREEVEPVGWNSLEGAYAFRYQDTEGKRTPLYIKCLAVGSQLLVHWVAGSGSKKEPQTLELDTAVYTTAAPSAPTCYQRMPELVTKLRQCLGSALARSPLKAGADDAAAAAGQRSSSRGAGQDVEPLHQPPGASGIGYRPPQGLPVGIGGDDLVPQGVRPPGYNGGPSFPGLMEPGQIHGGGGSMHVGPGDPTFGPGRLGGGVGGPPGHGGLLPGARWDPIAPPGMRGFNPDDYQHAQEGRPHPDMAQPGPGRGSDWDAMFG